MKKPNKNTIAAMRTALLAAADDTIKSMLEEQAHILNGTRKQFDAALQQHRRQLYHQQFRQTKPLGSIADAWPTL